MQRKPKHPRVNFKIGSCTSQDPECPATQLLLQTPECKGWQSGRYCPYPQTIILQLPQPFTINQITLLAHQYKIPSKVEVDYRNINDEEFKRLGYFSMGNNMESNFEVRELKNIPVTIQCNAVRFTMHKNHVNKYNMFNQVGIISVCLYGVPLGSQNVVKQKYVSTGIGNGEKAVGSSAGEKSSIKMIQELELKKKQAIENQDYEAAGKIKAKIDNIKKVHAQLDDLEERKKLALQKEDYSSAATIHEQIKRIKEGFERQDSKPQQQQQYIKQQPKPSARVHAAPPEQEEDNQYVPPPKKPEIKKSNPVHQQQQTVHQSKKPLNVDDIPINVKNTNPYQDPHDQQQEQTDNGPKKLQNLKGEQRKLYEQHFDIISQQIFQKILSRHHSYRQQGIEQLREIIKNPGGRNKNSLLRAVFQIIKLTLEDKIVNIIIQSQDLFYFTLEKMKPKINDSNLDQILHKISDLHGHNNDKVRQSSSTLMRQLPNFELTNKNICIKILSQPEGKKSPKITAGRLEALKVLIQNYDSGDYLEECALYAVKNIEDKTSEIRNASIQLLKILINQAGYQRVAPYLKNLRPAILKQLQDIDEKQQIPSNRQQVPINRKNQTKKYQQQLPPPKQNAKKVKTQEPVLDQCPYCFKRDPQFQNQDYRDIHLYNTCAMLMLCQCQQAIEVSSLSNHLTSECKNSKYYKKCPRCKEAVHQSKYKSHVESKDCNPAKPLAVANRCPLCHQDISPGVGGWKQHLVDIGCPNNSR